MLLCNRNNIHKKMKMEIYHTEKRDKQQKIYNRTEKKLIHNNFLVLAGIVGGNRIFEA